MNTRRFRIALPLLVTLTVGALGQGGVPPVPNPGTQQPWGPPTNTPVNRARVVNAMSGSMTFTTGTKTTRTRKVVACVQLGPAFCGGSGQVSAGASLSLFGVSVTISHAWTGPPADECELCAIFLCGNATETETTETGTTKYVNGLGKVLSTSNYSHGPTSTVVPDGTGISLKQKCIDTDEAKEFCCPDKAYSYTGGGSQPLGYLAYGDALVSPDQYGFGLNMPAPYEFDLLEVASITQIDLGSQQILAGDEWEGGPTNIIDYVAASANEMSLAERHLLAEHLIQSLDLLNPYTPAPTGRILVAVTSPDGDVTSIDLGTLEELTAFDTLRLANPADINMDFVVDEMDLEIVQQDLVAPSSRARGDVDLDGWVTEADLELVYSAMGGE